MCMLGCILLRMKMTRRQLASMLITALVLDALSFDTLHAQPTKKRPIVPPATMASQGRGGKPSGQASSKASTGPIIPTPTVVPAARVNALPPATDEAASRPRTPPPHASPPPAPPSTPLTAMPEPYLGGGSGSGGDDDAPASSPGMDPRPPFKTNEYAR